MLQSVMPNVHYGSHPIEPDEGQYDIRKGAAAYSSIAASIGSLAVTAIVVIFTVPSEVPEASIALAAGLLAIAFLGSILGSFGFAAIGAEQDPTANIGKAVLYASVAVSIAIVGTFGAFEVLASIYAPKSVWVFGAMTGLAGFFSILFTAASIPDSVGLHPRTMDTKAYDAWRRRQWLQSRGHALKVMYIVVTACGVPVLLATIVRISAGRVIALDSTGVNWVVLLGAVFTLVGAVMSFVSHPETGNDQRSVVRADVWTPHVLISLFTCVLLLTLP